MGKYKSCQFSPPIPRITSTPTLFIEQLQIPPFPPLIHFTDFPEKGAYQKSRLTYRVTLSIIRTWTVISAHLFKCRLFADDLGLQLLDSSHQLVYLVLLLFLQRLLKLAFLLPQLIHACAHKVSK